MKDTGKKISGVSIYSDPNIPKDSIYLINKKFYLPPESVKKYEKISGFKTNGKVTGELSSDAVFDLYGDLISSQPRRQGKLRSVPIKKVEEDE